MGFHEHRSHNRRLVQRTGMQPRTMRTLQGFGMKWLGSDLYFEKMGVTALGQMECGGTIVG